MKKAMRFLTALAIGLSFAPLAEGAIVFQSSQRKAELEVTPPSEFKRGYFYGAHSSLKCARVVVYDGAHNIESKFPCKQEGQFYETLPLNWNRFDLLLRLGGEITISIEFGGKGKWTAFRLRGQALKHWFKHAGEEGYSFYVPVDVWLEQPRGLPSLTLDGAGGPADITFFPEWTGLPPLKLHDPESRRVLIQALREKKFKLDKYYVKLFNRYDKEGR